MANKNRNILKLSNDVIEIMMLCMQDHTSS